MILGLLLLGAVALAAPVDTSFVYNPYMASLSTAPIPFAGVHGHYQAITADDLPALQVADGQMLLVSLRPCSALAPHYQTNCAETFFVKAGVLDVVMVVNGKLYRHELRRGDMTTVPKGVLHSFSNRGCEDTQVLVILFAAKPDTIFPAIQLTGLPQQAQISSFGLTNFSEFQASINVPRGALYSINDPHCQAACNKTFPGSGGAGGVPGPDAAPVPGAGEAGGEQGGSAAATGALADVGGVTAGAPAAAPGPAAGPGSNTMNISSSSSSSSSTANASDSSAANVSSTTNSNSNSSSSSSKATVAAAPAPGPLPSPLRAVGQALLGRRLAGAGRTGGTPGGTADGTVGSTAGAGGDKTTAAAGPAANSDAAAAAAAAEGGSAGKVLRRRLATSNGGGEYDGEGEGRREDEGSNGSGSNDLSDDDDGDVADGQADAAAASDADDAAGADNDGNEDSEDEDPIYNKFMASLIRAPATVHTEYAHQQRLTYDELPGLGWSQAELVLTRFKACSTSVPHFLPTADEFATVLSGTIDMILVVNGSQRVVRTMQPGDVAVMPRGTLHYFANANCQDNVMLVVTNKKSARRVLPVSDLMQLPQEVLAAALGLEGGVGAFPGLSATMDAPGQTLASLNDPQCTVRCGTGPTTQDDLELQVLVGKASPL